jgi:hypothetical protein
MTNATPRRVQTKCGRPHMMVMTHLIRSRSGSVQSWPWTAGEMKIIHVSYPSLHRERIGARGVDTRRNVLNSSIGALIKYSHDDTSTDMHALYPTSTSADPLITNAPTAGVRNPTGVMRSLFLPSLHKSFHSSSPAARNLQTKLNQEEPPA